MKNLVVREPQNRIAVRPQYLIASRVPRNFRFRRMRRAIDFDDEARVATSEIDDESKKRDLPSKSKPLNPVPTKRRPKFLSAEV
jgi:hypothetical protein